MSALTVDAPQIHLERRQSGANTRTAPGAYNGLRPLTGAYTAPRPTENQGVGSSILPCATMVPLLDQLVGPGVDSGVGRAV